MLDPTRYACLGDLLRDAVGAQADRVCLIEANRNRENARLTYDDFRRAGDALAGALRQRGLTRGERVAIIMTNQSRWLISAYAVFVSGGVLVPLDHKLTGLEHAALLAHCTARWLIIEHHLYRQLSAADGFDDLGLAHILVTEAPASLSAPGVEAWENCTADGPPPRVDRHQDDPACIVYSSGTGGRPKGCVLTHGNYLYQCAALMRVFELTPDDRYLSILPTNHAIDFMVGFIGPFVCGATVVHLRTLRPEFIRDALVRYRINYMAVVPMILDALKRQLTDRFAALSPVRRSLAGALIAVNRWLTRYEPDVAISRRLLPAVHRALGGGLKALFVGGAFTEPDTLRFFYDLGIPVANGYGLTEAGTAITLNDLHPFRADTVGTPLPGTEVRIVAPNADGVGEVAVRGKTVMSGYLDDPQLTARTIVNGWLMTGDLGRIDHTGHLILVGRKKNMIVTPGGKNVYPEDIEAAFGSLEVKEFCIFASNYLWPDRGEMHGRLIMVLRPVDGDRAGQRAGVAIAATNRGLADYKRVSAYVSWLREFPRTASMKIKRDVLARQVARSTDGPTAEIGS